MIRIEAEALWDRTTEEVSGEIAQARRRGRIVVSLCSYRDGGVTKHAVVLGAGDTLQRFEAGLDAASVPSVIARNAKDGFHPALVGMAGSAARPELALVFEKSMEGARPPSLLSPRPFRDGDGVFFTARERPREGLFLRSIAAAGAPTDARGSGLLIAGTWAPQPAVHVAWAVHLDALGERDGAWRERWEVRTLETVARPVMAIPIVADSGARFVLSLWHDRVLTPWPSPDPLKQARRFEVDEAVGAEALASAVARRRAEDRCVIALGAGSGARFIAVVGARGRESALPRYARVTMPGEDSPGAVMGDDIEGDERASSEHPLDAWALDHMRETGARHGQLVVVRRRRLAFARAYTLAEEGYPVARLDDAMRLGSVSKALTAMALLAAMSRLGVAGGVDAKLAGLLGFEEGEGPPSFAGVTVRQLLTHTAGFRTFADVRPDDPANLLSEQRIAALLGGSGGVATPGQLSAAIRALVEDGIFSRAPGATPPDYSNEGFVLLGELLSWLVGGRLDGYEDAIADGLLRAVGIDPGERGCLFGAGRQRASERSESPAHPASPTWAEKRFSRDDVDDGPLVVAPYADNGPFLGGAAGISVPLVWVARVLAGLGPNADGSGIWRRSEAEIAATPVVAGSSFGHGFHLGEAGYWSFRESRGGVPLTVRMDRLHHNGRLDGGAALLIHLLPRDAGEASDATLSVVAAFNQLGPLYEDPHGRRLLGILRQLEGSPGWDGDLFGQVG